MFVRDFPYPWSALALSIRRIPDSCGKEYKPLSSFFFYFGIKNIDDETYRKMAEYL
jgi:hypothetical protein